MAPAGTAHARPSAGGDAGTGSNRALHALLLASFAIGTGEFVIVGLVPGLATDLGVPVPTAGLLISVYALSVAFGSPVVAALLSSAPRRRALTILMLVFLVGDTACALAPDFRVLMAARIVTALAHGAFFGIASIVAAELAPRGQAVRAVALLFTGLPVAHVGGGPARPGLGQADGWRGPVEGRAVAPAAPAAAAASARPSASRRSGSPCWSARSPPRRCSPC